MPQLPLPRPVHIALLLLTASTATHAQTCEALQSQIEAKIKAAGVSQFTLSTVNTADTAPGKVVGTCAQGAKKIVYARADTATPSAPASKGILTECKDGSVTYGECKK